MFPKNFKPFVYLAGAIHGRTYYQAAQWRKEASEALESKFSVLNPMEGKVFLETTDEQGNPKAIHLGGDLDPHEIYTTDISNLLTSDVVLVNMEGVSGIGTLWEIGFAISQGILVVMWITDDHPMRHHPFIVGAELEGDMCIHTTLDEACQRCLFKLS